MSDIRMRGVEEEVKELLKVQARQMGVSLHDHLHQILKDQVARPRREFAAQARQRLEALKRQHGVFPDSAALIREDRDARG